MKNVPIRQRLIEVTKKHHAIAICLLLMTVGIRLNADEKKNQVADTNPIRIERRQVNIVVAAPKEHGHPCRVSIRIRCRATNTAETPQQLTRRVPVLLGGWQVQPEDYRGLVDGKPVKVKVDRIRFSSQTNPDAHGFGLRSPIPSPTKAQAAAWSKRLDNWMRQDPELRKLLDRYRKLSSVQKSLSSLTSEFESEVTKHLINEDLRYAARYIASGDDSLRNYVRLMPEVDPDLRYDIDFKRWKYLPYLNDYSPSSYEPYLQQWQATFATWIESKPKLAELAPKLRQAWESHRRAVKLLNEDIVKFWHDQCGLSLHEAIVLRDHISRQAFHDYVSPDFVELLKRLFPEVRQQQKAFTDEVVERMNRWGFDTKQLSVITGNLYPATLTPRHGFSRLNRDPTVAQALGQTIRNGSTDSPGATSQLPSGNYWQDIGSPHLLSLDVTIHGKQTADVVIEYEVPIEMLAHPSSSGGRFGGSISEIVAVLDPATRASEVELDVTLPTGIHPVISPSPDSVHELKNGKRSFRMHLKAPRQNVHINLVDFQTPQGASAYLYQFPRNEAEIETNLKLSGLIKNLTVQPILQAVRYTQLLRESRQFDAHKHLLEIRQTHPNFGGFDAITNQSESRYLALEAKQLYQWIEAKSQSPLFDDEKDFNRLESLFRPDLLAANESAVAELARHVEALSDKKLSLKQRMGRSLVLCQRGVEPQKNLAHLLQLAKSNDELTMHGLRLIQAMTVEKPSALPFVLQQIADAKREKRAIPASDPKWRKSHEKYNAGYHALRTFRSPQVASQLIEFIAKSNDGLLIQAAINSLGEMTLPHLFDDLVEIAGPIAGASHSGFYQYLELLIRSQPKRAIVVLGSMRQKYPQFAARISVLLSDHGDRLQLPAAIETYNTSTNKERLSAAVQSLKSFDDPNVIKQLKYRHGLDKWTNESLLSILRGRNGQRDAYPFIESFYHEFVKGKKANHHLDCVAAFEAAGDQRAIPYLIEILKTTERKDDAAHAIGNLMHDRRIHRSPRSLEYKLAGFIDDAQDPRTPAVERDEALKMLLQTPEASMKRMIERGRIKDLLSGDSSVVWQEEDEKRLRYLSRFGDTAVKHLLDASRGCSLSTRYQLKHLFKMAQTGSRRALRESAGSKSADIDQRRTAILTLGAMRDKKSVTVLANLLEDRLLRGNAIDALASIGTPDARQALRDLKGQLVSDEHVSVLRRNAWNAKLENAGLE